MQHKNWIRISGLMWSLIGGFLLYKGIHLMELAIFGPQAHASLSHRLGSYVGGDEKGATAIIALSLLVGFIKGRFVLSKTVHRVCNRIASLSLPISFSQVYSPVYFLLIGSMILLGVGMRFAPIPIDLRGAIDIAVGSALINGSLLYFRAAQRFIPVSHTIS